MVGVVVPQPTYSFSDPVETKPSTSDEVVQHRKQIEGGSTTTSVVTTTVSLD